MKKITIFMVCLLESVFLLSGCSHSDNNAHRLSKEEKARLDSIDQAAFKIGVMPTLDCMPVYVAYDRHLFDSLGVTVHLRYYTAQMDCDTALTHGRVEGAISDLIRIKRMQDKGAHIYAPIATDTYWQLYSNKRARIMDLKQLSDKMIAITRYSATDYFANLAIDSAKPKYDVYRVQINDVNIRLKMLLNNEMDAVLLAEPQATKAKVEGHKMLMDSRWKKQNLGAFAFQKNVEKNPVRIQQMKLFYKAYNAAVDSINQYGLKHYADLMKKYCKADPQTIKALPKFHYSHALPPRMSDQNVASTYYK